MKKKIYFLHVPKSGGTSCFHICRDILRLQFKENVSNGNWMVGYKNRVPFWTWSEEEQRKAFDDVDVLFNENNLGDAFYPDKVKYVVCIRNPIDCVISMYQNQFVKNVKRYPSLAEFDQFLQEQQFRNWWLKFFYKQSCNDPQLLKAVFQERIAHFSLIFMSSFSRDAMNVFGLAHEPKIHAHRRYGDRIKLNDLSKKTQQYLKDSLHEDLEMFHDCRRAKHSKA